MKNLEIIHYQGVEELKECIVIAHSWTCTNTYYNGVWDIRAAKDLDATKYAIAVFHVHPKK